MSPPSSNYIIEAIGWLSGFGNNEDQKSYHVIFPLSVTESLLPSLVTHCRLVSSS